MHLSPGRLQEMVDDAVKGDTAIICHSTLETDNAVCKGFYDKHKTTPLQIAERLGLIKWQYLAADEGR